MSNRVFIVLSISIIQPWEVPLFLFPAGLFPLLLLVLVLILFFLASPFAVRKIRGYVRMDKGKERVWESFQKGAGLEGACRCV